MAEVPALVGSFPTTAGRVQRVGFGRSLWDAVPHRTRGWVDGPRIGLDGFAAFAADVVWVAASIAGSAPLFLLVVPPDTEPDVAAGILRRAGSADSLETPAEAARPAPRRRRHPRASRRWRRRMDDAGAGRHEEQLTTTCQVCPHRWADHDALGRRFCSATREVGWERGCICR